MAWSLSFSRRSLPLLTAVAALALTGCGADSGGAATAAKPASVKLPAGALMKDGQITYCSDISAPPLAYYDVAQKPTGAEVELGDALAAAFGVRANWANTSFNGIIPALRAKQCDVIISQLYIKPEREKVVDFVPYMYASNTLVVAEKDAGAVKGADDLCGKKAAGQTGTTVVQYLTDRSAQCAAAGKPKIDIRQFTKDSDALQQLRIGLVDAYGTTLETAAYVLKQQPDTFALVGQPFNRIKVGAATRKGDTALHDGLTKALATVRGDGTYGSILTKWNLTGDDISR
ncbi:ABC transporter substrate-binding protein [Streptomyces acidiscabies]|uniref:ABC transporter substrate-binding protein n=1 Tax=Streptomyces acidiscabies TaxID=42234 RepID=A0AAP6EKI6_9ACTN|nr:ABC transporter substrate-binding protein [Streptomyces acidiscabies]MBP5941193.1 ABC transporter substrate-binding protein [Streptomyces sp. LBUM 1476]MBZ3912519.1 ABC transporter substrate-binding protein [Streptomyces acidiscabies]MDX2966033.1 ABC transporter substrate-binding protein [Streptomyces acidiscabies]MDX3025505.1 ABC transporter substrate-binding protein [Streptomyces acidiscabies]MDX3796082.1 ABC transporter substrate-binding protein [Streptomyces acidiscabies]